MRGIAAITVAIYHICWALDPFVFQPRNDEKTRPGLWQLPIIRVMIAGRPSVAMFFLLTGFTNVARAIKSSQNGDTDSAYRALGRSAAKRASQLVLPTAAATVLNWLLCQFEIFTMAAKADSPWIRDLTPEPSKSFLSAITHLLTAIQTTWTRERNYYGQEQWCMMRLLGASMTVYTVMLSTVKCRPMARITIIMGLIVYSFLMNDCKLILVSAFLSCLT
jgi:hypothetical protein